MAPQMPRLLDPLLHQQPSDQSHTVSRIADQLFGQMQTYMYNFMSHVSVIKKTYSIRMLQLCRYIINVCNCMLYIHSNNTLPPLTQGAL